MFLKRLDITGFKSFAQKTALEFDRGIVSIVGPNGSGKSNVADAIRWVLGEQSMKLLRGKKSDDVIFSGSSLKARLGMAEVSLWLDNSDRQMPVDYSEIVITRRVYRNGEGEYFLNKNAIRLADMHLLLAKSNIGQKSYSVIGQGMIDHVLVATPAERKIFFDEAAGVRQYQIKREQALHKLEQTKENLSQAQMLLAEIEPRLRTLTRQVRRLERRGAIAAELQTLQEQYYRQRHLSLSGQLAALDQQHQEQLRQQQEHEGVLQGLQIELEKLERERSRQEVFQDLQRKYSKVLEQKNAVMKEQVVLEGAAELEAAKSGELNVVWLTNRNSELERSQQDLEEEIAALETENTRQQGLHKERQAQLDALHKKIAALEEHFQKVQHATGTGVDHVAGIESELKVLHEEFSGFQTKVEKAEHEQHWHKLKGEVRRFTERLGALLKRFQQLRGRIQPDELLQRQTEFANVVRTKDGLQSELHELTTQLERRRERLAVLRESRTRLGEELQRVQREVDRLAPDHRRRDAVPSQREQLEMQIRQFDKKLQQLREQIVNFNQEEQQKKEHLFSLQKAFRVKQNELSGAAAQVNATRVEMAKLETRRDDVTHELRGDLPAALAETITQLTADSPMEHVEPEEKLLAAINEHKHQLELIGGIDEGVTAEFKQTDDRHGFLAHQVNDLVASIASLEQVIEQLDATIKEQFHKSFTAIGKEFSKYFRVLFNGGNARLVLQEAEVPVDADDGEDEEDSGDDEEEPATPAKKRKMQKIIAGVEIIAAPPGKRISGITMLSGGERALTSIALICAILANRPSPFVVLDEVDAALDEANTQRFAAILKELSRTTQFITITHNRSTMQISSILYGITMSDDGVSKLLSIKMEEAEAVIANHGNRA